MIEKHGFALTRMEPRLTPEKIEHIAKVDRGEKFAQPLPTREMIARVVNELACLKTLNPVAAVTGSYVTIPLICRFSECRWSGSCNPPGCPNFSAMARA